MKAGEKATPAMKKKISIGMKRKFATMRASKEKSMLQKVVAGISQSPRLGRMMLSWYKTL